MKSEARIMLWMCRYTNERFTFNDYPLKCTADLKVNGYSGTLLAAEVTERPKAPMCGT